MDEEAHLFLAMQIRSSHHHAHHHPSPRQQQSNPQGVIARAATSSPAKRLVMRPAPLPVHTL
jgi:hypothetical protein